MISFGEGRGWRTSGVDRRQISYPPPLFFFNDLVSFPVRQCWGSKFGGLGAPFSKAPGPSCLSRRQGLGQRRADPRGSAAPAVLLRSGEAPQHSCVCLLSSHARVSELALQSHGGADEAMELVGFSATRATRTDRLRRAPPYSWARGRLCNLGKPSPLPRAGPGQAFPGRWCLWGPSAALRHCSRGPNGCPGPATWASVREGPLLGRGRKSTELWVSQR